MRRHPFIFGGWYTKRSMSLDLSLDEMFNFPPEELLAGMRVSLGMPKIQRDQYIFLEDIGHMNLNDIAKKI